MALRIGDIAPDFEAETTHGPIKFHDWIGDTNLNVAKLYDMLPASAGGDPADRTPVDNQTVRTVFVIGPDKKVRLQITYPMTTGRNFDEILRVVDSMQLTEAQPVATPVNWKPGDDVIIVPSVSNEEAEKKFPKGFTEHKPYLRTTPDPS
jgi:alkyl hydroperoxide reductase subunit AhpC